MDNNTVNTFSTLSTIDMTQLETYTSVETSQPTLITASTMFTSSTNHTVETNEKSCSPCEPSIHIPLKTFSTQLEKTVLIDVAALCQEYSPVDVMCNTNITILDDIYINMDCFTKIFYPELNQFGIDKQIVHNQLLYPFISLEDKYRTVNKTPFFLCNTILKGIENDLNIPRNCFTLSSLIEITNEFTNITNLCDLNCCSVVASLPWDNVMTIIKNYETHHKKKSFQF